MSIYTDNGFENRAEYFEDLAVTYEVPLEQSNILHHFLERMKILMDLYVNWKTTNRLWRNVRMRMNKNIPFVE